VISLRVISLRVIISRLNAIDQRAKLVVTQMVKESKATRKVAKP
jgi:hypothetical protein